MTGEPPKGVIVFLHGWGANAQDLAPLSQLLNLPDYQFLFPNAPFPHPYVSTGRMWYNLHENQGQGLAESRQSLIEWLQSLESTTGIPLSHTILSGFSQGGAMTLDVGLTLPLAGLTSLSGYLHPLKSITATHPPVLIVHGRQDYVVPLSAAISAREQLMQSGVAVQYHEFEMGHEIRPEAIPVIRDFVVTKLSGESKQVS
ncbi:alpha/beta hydrolase [Gloeocapsopsis sp. IPPAS B-1203]|uniref:alpha/beta hydrolase n=1 Tax=Gloeocapsopsis sp. IPPAS B-1203 TaxID=2049454 RepID=UPI000C17ECEA|nr:alpha/beta hydrolase [Gloeocapsopsis sp. IPPAS B-1203]PIG90688.1 serine esterase [Gloeocapsopsis sp. IPPAS B-1203]